MLATGASMTNWSDVAAMDSGLDAARRAGMTVEASTQQQAVVGELLAADLLEQA